MGEEVQFDYEGFFDGFDRLFSGEISPEEYDRECLESMSKEELDLYIEDQFGEDVSVALEVRKNKYGY